MGFLENARYPNGTQVAMVAAIQNFGAPRAGIPPRPFFTNMVKAEAAGWGAELAARMKKNDNDTKRSLVQLGFHIEGQLRQAIVDTDSPPNSPVTNLLKQRFPMGGQTFADVLKARADIKAGIGKDAPPGKPLSQSGDMLRKVGSDVK